jgi:hypothetical protein
MAVWSDTQKLTTVNLNWRSLYVIVKFFDGNIYCVKRGKSEKVICRKRDRTMTQQVYVFLV